jgi:hypothetical protein
MFAHQNEANLKIADLEKKVMVLESKLDIPKLLETVTLNLKSNSDEWLSTSLTINCIKEEMERRYKRSRLDLAEFAKEYKKSEKDLKDNQNKVIGLEEQLSKLQLFLDDILTDLKLKAYNGDLIRVEKTLESKCSIVIVNDLASQVKLMCKAEDLHNTQSVLKKFQEKVDKEYLQTHEILSEIEKAKKNIIDLMENYSTKEYTDNFNQKFYKKYKKTNKKFEDLSELLNTKNESVDKIIKDLKSEVHDKVSHKDLDKLSQEIASKSSKQDLTRYLSEISPKISGFQTELSVFNRILREQEQAMLRLDEILLEKASKLETFDLYKKIELISKHTDIEYKIDEMIRTQNIIKEDFNNIQSDIRHIQLQFSEMQTIHSKKTNEILEIKFLKDLILEIQTCVSYKADRNEILHCLEQKAGWGDFSHLSESIESVHRQIKLLAVQVGAIEKITAPSGKLRSAERTQREYFNKITTRLVNYVVGSKPLIDENPVPDEIKAFLKLPNTPKIHDHKTRQNTPNKRTHHSFDLLHHT